MAEKTTYAAIAAKEVWPPTRVISPEGDKGKEAALKVGTKEVKGISFVGKQVCAMLTASACAPIPIRRIVFEGSAITHLEKVDPLSSET